MVGEILGKDNEFSISILQHFVSLVDMNDLEIDEALRLFCSRFSMPGESQMVYRVLERFSTHYVACNTSGRLTQDDVHTLTYALIMLNVTMHSSKVKDRMSREAFIMMVREAAAAMGADGQERCGSMYDRISAQEIRPDTSMTEELYKRISNDPRMGEVE